jgi:branched-chain amino acid transport system ATP-binding protein
VLMIEHHVPLVVGVCDYVYVLNFGKVLTQGKPSQVQSHPEVIAAYLGGEAEKVGAAATTAEAVDGAS